MTAHSVLYIPSVFRERGARKKSEKIPFDLSWKEVKLPLMYMLCMSLLGLMFYPAVLGLVIMWVYAWRHNRNVLTMMLFLFFGSYSLLPDKIMMVKFADLGMLAGFAAMLVVKKRKPLKMVLFAYVFQCVGTIIICTYSLESMAIQFRIFRYYLSFITVFIPILIFANQKFDIMSFFRTIMIFALIMSGFYLTDAYILKGFVLVPNSFNYGIESTWLHPVMNIFSMTPARKYPVGMYILGLAILPMVRYYSLKWWQILIFAGGVLATQTFTYMLGVLVCLILFQPSRKRIMRWILFGSALAIFMVGIDFILPYDKQKRASTFRIRSTIEQFQALASATDDEDLAEFMSGRVGQALPVLELIEQRHCQMTGLGFIHPDMTTNVNLIIFNEYESDIEKAEHVAANVEIILVMLYAYVGWMGLLVELIFFIMLFRIIRKMKYRAVFTCIVVFTFVLGWGGFAGMYTYSGLSLLTLSYAMVLLAERAEKADTERDDDTPQSQRRSLMA